MKTTYWIHPQLVVLCDSTIASIDRNKHYIDIIQIHVYIDMHV